MKKWFVYSVLFFLLIPLVLFTLVKSIDVTQEPVQADIVVCLGGGTVERVKKSIILIEDGYVEKDRFLLLGESWYNQPYIRKNHPTLNVVIEETPTNTKEEVLFIKQYMVKNGYRSALVVTDPFHSGRVSVLNSILSVQGAKDIHLYMIDSGRNWWEKEGDSSYLLWTKRALNESIKIIYSIVVYGFLDF